MLKAVQYSCSVLALYLLAWGILYDLWLFTRFSLIVWGGVAVLGALLALRCLWLLKGAPLKGGAGVTSGALLTLPLAYSPVNGAASLALLLVGAAFLLHGLGKLSPRRRS